MNNIHFKPHIPEGEDGFTLPKLDSSVSITTSLFHSLPSLSLAKLLTASTFHASSNEEGPLQILRSGAVSGVFNLTSSSRIPTDFIITSPDKAAAFPYFFYVTKRFFSPIPSVLPDIFIFASPGIFLMPMKSMEGMMKKLLNLTSSSGLPTGSIILYRDKSKNFPYFSNTTNFLAYSILSSTPDTFFLASS